MLFPERKHVFFNLPLSLPMQVWHVRKTDIIMGYLYVYTDDRLQRTVFHDTEDFISGMNSMAICLLNRKIRLLAYCLMDNHVHFIMHATDDDAKDFMSCYKRMLSRHLKTRYGIMDSLYYAKTGIRTIEDDRSLKIAIAYCLRNPFVAGMEADPVEYRWSSAGYYYGSIPEGLNRIESLSIRKQRTHFGTRAEIPADFLYDKRGMIHPSCYVQCEEVRRLFSNEGNFIHYLFKRVEKEAAEEDTANPAVRDSVVLKGLQRLLAQSGAVSLYELMNAERTRILKELRFRYNLTERQLERIAGH